MDIHEEETDRSNNDISEELKKYKSLYDFAPVGYFTWDEQGMILESNYTAAKLLGVKKSVLIGMPFKDFVAQVNHDRFDRHLADLLHTGERQHFELQLIRSNGSSFFAFLACIGITDSHERVVQCLVMVADISARKQIEEELQKSEKRYRHIVEDQTELICRYQPDSVLTFVNGAYCRFFNMNKEDLIGRKFFTLIPEKDHDQMRQVIALLSRKQPRVTIQHRILLSDGKIGWQEWTNRIIFNKQGKFVEYQAVGRDITDLKKAEKALNDARDELERRVEERTAQLQEERQCLLEERDKRNQTEEALIRSEGHFRGIYDHIGVGIALISPDMEILTMNPQMKAWFPAIDSDAKPICYRAFNDPARESVCSYCPTYLSLQDGQVHESVADTPRGQEIRNYRIIASPLKDKTGQIVAAIEMVTDITESFQSQQRLEESELRYRTVLENTGTAMMIINKDRSIAFVNREFEKQSGYARSEIVGSSRSLPDMLMPEDATLMEKYHIQRRIDPESVPSSYEFRYRNRSGHIRSVMANVTMIPGTTMSVASMIDITELKQTMEELKIREQELAGESNRLFEMNTALKVLLQQREDDRKEMQMMILSNVRKLVLPYVDKLNRTQLNPIQANYVNVIAANLNNIISPFLRTLEASLMDLTPREIEVAQLVRDGKTAKEIADMLNISVRSIESHKDNLRRKMGLNNKKINLRTHLMSLT